MSAIDQALEDMFEALNRVSYGSVGIRFVVQNKRVVRIEHEFKSQKLVDNTTEPPTD